jgi:hypothetical protein
LSGVQKMAFTTSKKWLLAMVVAVSLSITADRMNAPTWLAITLSMVMAATCLGTVIAASVENPERAKRHVWGTSVLALVLFVIATAMWWRR